MADSELEQYRRAFGQIQAGARDLAAGLNEERFNWRPAPDQRSIEECLGHLIIVGQWQVAAIERAIDSARARGVTGSGPFRYGRLESWILHRTEPPVHWKAPAPRRFRPLHGQPVTAVLPTFLHLQSQFLIQIDRAEGLHLVRVKVPTPITRLLRMSLGIAFAQAAAHERRHLEQARRVRELLPESAAAR